MCFYTAILLTTALPRFVTMPVPRILRVIRWKPSFTLSWTCYSWCTHSSGLHPSTPRCISVGSKKNVSVTATLLHKLLQSVVCCLRTLVLGKHDCFLYCLLQCSSHYSQKRASSMYNLLPQPPGFQVSSFLGSPYCCLSCVHAGNLIANYGENISCGEQEISLFI